MAKKNKQVKRKRSRPNRFRDWAGAYAAGDRDEKGEVELHARSDKMIGKKPGVSQDVRDTVNEDMYGETTEAIVYEVYGQLCKVCDNDGSEHSCTWRRVLELTDVGKKNLIVVGDKVTIGHTPEGDGVILRIHPREGILSRAAAHGRREEHIIASNVDQLLIVASILDPEIRLGLIDRYLICAERAKLKPIIIINKIDLGNTDEIKDDLNDYAEIGYKHIELSAKTGTGINALRDVIKNKTSVVAGQSGVGKSTILTSIQPGLFLRVAQVHEASGQGRHTTTGAKLIPLDIGGFVVDTAGIREFGLHDMHHDELERYMPDISRYLPECTMPDCTHIHEPNCGVINAVEQGELSFRRYEAYLNIHESLKQGRR